jgi:hypothetical protein
VVAFEKDDLGFTGKHLEGTEEGRIDIQSPLLFPYKEFKEITAKDQKIGAILFFLQKLKKIAGFGRTGR